MIVATSRLKNFYNLWQCCGAYRRYLQRPLQRLKRASFRTTHRKMRWWLYDCIMHHGFTFYSTVNRFLVFRLESGGSWILGMQDSNHHILVYRQHVQASFTTVTVTLSSVWKRQYYDHWYVESGTSIFPFLVLFTLSTVLFFFFLSSY